MTQDFVSVCRKIVAERQALLVKPSKKGGFLVREDDGIKRIPAGYFWVDAFSASALVTALDGLNADNARTLAALAEANPLKAITVAFKLCK